MRVYRHIAPKQQGDAALCTALLEDAHAGCHAFRIHWQKHHGHAVIALVGQQAPVLLRFLAEEAVRNLKQDARTVAGVLLEAHAAAVLQVHEHGQRIVDHLVGTLSLQVGERADAACVVFEFLTVQTLIGRVFHRRAFHGNLPVGTLLQGQREAACKVEMLPLATT